MSESSLKIVSELQLGQCSAKAIQSLIGEMNRRLPISSARSKRCSRSVCVHFDFGPADEQLLSKLAEQVSVNMIENGIILACARETSSILAGSDRTPIRSFSYFKEPIDEVRRVETT